MEDNEYLTNFLNKYIEYTLNEDNSGYVITRFSPDYDGPSSIMLPDSYLGKSVVSIGSKAFLDNKTLTTIFLPDTITTISRRAFKNCSNLVSIYLPKSVVNIKEKAFRNCTSLRIFSSATSVSKGWKAYWNIDSCVVYFANSWIKKGMEIKSIFELPFNESFYELELNPADFFTYEEKNNHYVITGLSNSFDGRSYLKIPSSYLNKPVTTIASKAFTFPRLINIIIPKSITSIEDNAFFHCLSLVNVIMSSLVPSITFSIFSDCPNLQYPFIDQDNENFKFIDGVLFNKDGTVLIKYPVTNTNLEYTIPDSVTSIRDHAFSNCSCLVNVVISNSVTSIGDWAFRGCTSLESINLPDSLLTIGDNAFAYCGGLINVNLPKSITSIGYFTFGRCLSLDNLILPDSVVSIGDGAFRGCSSLTNITIPNSIISIGNWAFRGCTSLVSITIPDSLAKIGDWTFRGCAGLTNINIPSSILSIGECAFAGCTSLVSLSIPYSVSAIYPAAFSNCPSLKEFIVDPNNEYFKSSEGVLFSKDGKTIIKYPGNKEAKNYSIPNTVTEISSFAFDKCKNLVTINIPESLLFIGERAFGCCPSLSNIDVDRNNKCFKSVEGILFSKDGAILIEYPGSKVGESYVIPNTVTEISSYAFDRCKYLTSIRVSESVLSIGEYAFSFCESLINVIIPKSVVSFGSSLFILSFNARVFTDFERVNKYWVFECGNDSTIKVYFADQWEYVDGVPTPNWVE